MFKIGSLVRWGAGVLLSLVVVAAGSLAFQKTPSTTWGNNVVSAEIISAGLHRDCAVLIKYKYNNPYASNYKVEIRRKQSPTVDGFEQDTFLDLSMADKSGEIQEYLDFDVPQGIWVYSIIISRTDWNTDLQNQVGGIESEWSDPVVVDSELCEKSFTKPFPADPIAEAKATGTCDIDVSVQIDRYKDDQFDVLSWNPTDGIRIYRSLDDGLMNLLTDMPLEQFFLGEHDGLDTGHYIDKGLPAGTYTYMAETYNANKVRQSYTNPVTIDNAACKSLVDINIPSSVKLQPIETEIPQTLPEVPQACVWQAAVNVFLRKGPNVALFEVADAVEQGQTYPVVGQSEDGKFWVVEFRPGKHAYITKSETYSVMTGDCSQVPTIQDPLAPLPPLTEQVTEDNNPVDDNSGSGVSECGDGVDNDGDGQVDGSDRGCIASGGAHE